MDKIVLTGPESSGKTTLCNMLSIHFNIPFAKEYAREHLQYIKKNYVKEDLLKIAKRQLNAEKNITLLDTDLITIKIWSEYKYGSCDKWILNHIEKQKSEDRIYLLCKPDIQWEQDQLRETPLERMKLFRLYEKELIKLKHVYFIIDGEERKKKAISKLSSIKSIHTFVKS